MPSGKPIPIKHKVKIAKLALLTKEGGGKMKDVAEIAGIAQTELTRWVRDYKEGKFDKEQDIQPSVSDNIDLSAISAELKRLGNIGEKTNKILLKLIDVLKSMPEEDDHGTPISEEDEENFMEALENSGNVENSSEDNQESGEEEHY